MLHEIVQQIAVLPKLKITNLLGLRVLLYADTSEYLPTSEAVGFRITIHDKWVVPFPDAFGYNAPTGFLSSFGVRMVICTSYLSVIISEIFMKKLNLNQKLKFLATSNA